MRIGSTGPSSCRLRSGKKKGKCEKCGVVLADPVNPLSLVTTITTRKSPLTKQVSINHFTLCAR